MKRKRVIILCALVFLIIAELIFSYEYLSITKYEISSDKIDREVKIAVISDLHNHKFGRNNKRLVKKLEKLNPDLVLMAGDMIDEEAKDMDDVIELIQQIVKNIPVYYSLGNQEIDYMERNQSKNLIVQLTSAGAVVLEQSYEKITINGNELCIGGIYEYAFALDGEGHMDKEELEPEIRGFLEEFQEQEEFKLMLAHRPDSFIFGEASSTWNIDLVVSGHDHGGQVILPGKGGLYGADQGWFPQYVSGYHELDKLNIVITRGLGSGGEKLPRFNNPPEIMMLTLK
jgi:hypothetical protein